MGVLLQGTGMQELSFEIELIENEEGEYILQYRASHASPFQIHKVYKSASAAIDGYGTDEEPGKDFLSLVAYLNKSKPKPGRILKYSHRIIRY